MALLLLFTLVSVRLDILLSFQGNEMYTALQQLDAPAFWRSLIVFAVLASINVALVLINFYVAQRQIINWRLWLNNRMLDDWLGGAAYHRSRYVAEPIDNPDQRIQEDITSFAGVSQGLALGAVSSMVSLVSFSIILWGLSGPLTLAGVTIPRGMVFVAYVYVIIATVIAFRIGRPLIRLNFLNELLTASYRYALVRTRENSENIAFYRGEPVEKTGLLGRFAGVIGNAWDIVFRSLKFQGFNLVVNQIAVVFPIILQARRYFSGQITLGDVTQTATAFGQVFGALSFFRLAYDDFASYRAVLDRLTGLLDVNDEARALPSPVTEVAPDRPHRPRPPDPAARRPVAAHRPGSRGGRGQHLVDHRTVRHRQDHPAAQHGRAVAERRGSGRAAGGRGHAVLLPAALPAARVAPGGPVLPDTGRRPVRRRRPRRPGDRAAGAPG